MNKDLSLEELLKVATEGEQDEVAKENKRAPLIPKSVADFIKDFKIKVGTEKIPTFVLYFLYKVHWKRYVGTKLKKVTFFKEFSKIFEQKRNGKQRYYLLGDLELTQEIINKAEKFAEDKKENSHAKKPQKKIKAFHHKISGFDA